MKRFCNYTFRAVCVYIVLLIGIVFLTSDSSVETVNKNAFNENLEKKLNSFIISKKIGKEICFDENLKGIPVEKEPEPTIEITPEPTPTPTPEVKSSYTYVQTVDTSGYPVLSTVWGDVSHYGHDCYGCTTGKTATGYDISDGRIYYTDSTYGSVRIVASGAEYPFGTILRISNSTTSPIIAIVLDRGGAIGSGKKYILDLLTESNAAAYAAGVKYNMTIEVLRMGY